MPHEHNCSVFGRRFACDAFEDADACEEWNYNECDECGTLDSPEPTRAATPASAAVVAAQVL